LTGAAREGQRCDDGKAGSAKFLDHLGRPPGTEASKLSEISRKLKSELLENEKCVNGTIGRFGGMLSGRLSSFALTTVGFSWLIFRRVRPVMGGSASHSFPFPRRRISRRCRNF